MRRRRFLLGAGLAAFGGCSAGGGDAGRGTPDANRSRNRSGTESPTPQSPTEPPAEEVRSVAEAREHLAAAFDELRAMRPVGRDSIRVSASRFRTSDHEVVGERVAAAAAALDRAGAADRTPESVEALRAAVDLARAGRTLYASVRRAFRAEWRFERHCFGAEWADARDRARRAGRAVAAWASHGRAVAEAASALESTGPQSVPRLSPGAWRRDGAVLGGVAGPWGDVLEGFGGFAEAVGLDEAGLVAMDGEEYRTAAGRFASAANAVREAHRRLARAKAEGAQGFQSYAVPIRRRCEPFRRAYATQVDAARAALAGETDRAGTLDARAMDRILAAELEHPFPEPEGGSAAGSGSGSG